MKIHIISNNRRVCASVFAALVLLPVCVLLAQGTPPLAKPGNYTGQNISGELVRAQNVNLKELATSPLAGTKATGPEIQQTQRRDALHPPIHDSGPVVDRVPALT